MVLVVTSSSSFRGPSSATVPRPHVSEKPSQRHPQGAALHVAEQEPVTRAADPKAAVDLLFFLFDAQRTDAEGVAPSLFPADVIQASTANFN